jgi:hypothetical protein
MWRQKIYIYIIAFANVARNGMHRLTVLTKLLEWAILHGMIKEDS